MRDMEDLFDQILNGTTALGYYIRRLEQKDRLECKKLLKQIEQALLMYKVKCNGTDTN